MTPRATYRLQLNEGFGFEAVTRCAPYLAALGVSHTYLSPYLRARPGSTHGYDIVDHAQLNPELGDDDAFTRMVQTLAGLGLHQILDFVPNHMGVGGADNPLWLDVLEWGPEAAHAGWFDIEWETQRRYLHNKLLVPLLGNHYGIELERGVLELRYDEREGSFAVWAYGTHKLPITPTHYARLLGSEHADLERLGDGFAWLPTSRHQMPRRALELKAELAHAVQSRPDVREALYSRLTRFEGCSGDLGSWRELDTLIQRQHWRLAYFRVAADDINYRRFFNINDLAGLRVELPEVFEHAHQRVLRLIREGSLGGLRIDHIDGLLDPKAYLQRLRQRVTEQLGPDNAFYIVIEKILAGHESLREDWPVDGTTGYEFLNQLTALLVDSSAEQTFTECYRLFTGEQRDFAEIGRLSKLHIMDQEMAGELNVLARDIARLARQNPRTADFTQPLLRRAIKQLIACFPVYRTYMDGAAKLDAAGLRDLEWALAQARRHESEIDPSAFDFLEQVLTGRLIEQARSGYSRVALLRCATRLQQYSGPVAAKGIEDTAFYRYHRFIALNEVGGDPHRFGATMSAFHRATQLRAQRWPNAMLATATHDTKRGEDARARLAALSEYAEEWTRQVPLWSRILRGPDASATPQPDRNDEYGLYQQMLGSWPVELLDERACRGRELAGFAARLRENARKSMREARVHTSWAFPDPGYENAMMQLIDTALVGARAGAFLPAFLPLAHHIATTGMRNSLVQTVLKLTVPGVPDIYHGADLWDLSMVDPDNRRHVDYERRARELASVEDGLSKDRTAHLAHWLAHWSDGRIKLALIVTLLRHRQEQPALYAHGEYVPLPAAGPRAEEVGAFARSRSEERFVVAFARHTRRQERAPLDDATCVPLTAAIAATRWFDLLSGTEMMAVGGGALPACTLFARLPVAVLIPA